MDKADFALVVSGFACAISIAAALYVWSLAKEIISLLGGNSEIETPQVKESWRDQTM